MFVDILIDRPYETENTRCVHKQCQHTMMIIIIGRRFSDGIFMYFQYTYFICLTLDILNMIWKGRWHINMIECVCNTYGHMVARIEEIVRNTWLRAIIVWSNIWHPRQTLLVEVLSKHRKVLHSALDMSNVILDEYVAFPGKFSKLHKTCWIN